VETIFALLFILISVSLAGAAFALIWKNISDISKSSNKIEVESRTVKRTVHPELLDVKPGDELMVVNFKEQDQSDPIYKSLQERIDELTEEEDDDDDGGLVVRT
jgi:hypothetical protein